MSAKTKWSQRGRKGAVVIVTTRKSDVALIVQVGAPCHVIFDNASQLGALEFQMIDGGAARERNEQRGGRCQVPAKKARLAF